MSCLAGGSLTLILDEVREKIAVLIG